MKTSELTGPALDYSVAQCEGLDYWRIDITPTRWTTDAFMPSTNWAQGGPIIEREGILNGPSPFLSGKFAACIGHEWDTGLYIMTGPTPLIAAMRCYVASKLGDEVNIPDNL